MHTTWSAAEVASYTTTTCMGTPTCMLGGSGAGCGRPWHMRASSSCQAGRTPETSLSNFHLYACQRTHGQCGSRLVLPPIT